MNTRLRSALAISVLAALAGATPESGAAALPFDDLSRAGDVICSFQKSGRTSASRRPHLKDDDLMVIIEGIGSPSGSATVYSSRTAGANPARIYSSETGVHFVQDINDSVVVTTVLACESWKSGRGGRKCSRYSAVNAWHFDRSVHQHPDRVFLALPGTSYTGHCEPWNID